MKRKHTYKTSHDRSPACALRPGVRHRPFLYAISVVVVICSWGWWPGASGAEVTALPGLAQWESQMISYGKRHCTAMMTGKDTYGHPVDLLSVTYYDATLVYLQISKYTNDASWQACAQKAKTIYRDSYVLRSDLMGSVPGYWNFTTGLTMDYQMTGDKISKTAVTLLSQNAAYAPSHTPIGWTASPLLGREVAYTIRAYLNAEKLGVARRAKLADFVNQALGHIDKWFVTKTYRFPVSNPPGYTSGKYYVQPFMVGLCMEGLIMYHEATGDARVLTSVKVALDWLWANAWVAADQAFWYENYVSDPSISFPRKPGAADLNLLIAPAYAWYYKMTGDTVYRDRGDQVFAGGVKGAYLYGAKQFNQNYSYGFDYVSRRNAGDTRTTQPTASTTPSGNAITFVGPATTDIQVVAPAPSIPTASVPETENVVVTPAPSTPAASAPPSMVPPAPFAPTTSAPSSSAPTTSAPSSSITSPSGDDSPQPNYRKARKCKYAMSVAC